MRFALQFVPAVATLTALLAGIASAVVHDEQFVPEAVLRVTEETTKQSCVPEKDILLVNGTSPGPALVFKEGATIWIRVYNDIPHQNLTMVCSNHLLCTRWRPWRYRSSCPKPTSFLPMRSYSWVGLSKKASVHFN